MKCSGKFIEVQVNMSELHTYLCLAPGIFKINFAFALVFPYVCAFGTYMLRHTYRLACLYALCFWLCPQSGTVLCVRCAKTFLLKKGREPLLPREAGVIFRKYRNSEIIRQRRTI